MPANISNGWTGASLGGPSYNIVNSILNNPGSTTSTAPITAPPVSPTTSPGGGPPNPTRKPLPSTPPVNPPGFSDYTDLLQNTLSSLGQGGRTGKQYTPEQAYANYLGARGAAENTTPFSNALNVLGQGIFLPGVYGTQSNLPGQGFGFGAPSTAALPGYTPQATQILNQMLQGPQYSLAYGAAPAQAPAPTPQWGYPSNYGQYNAGGGWTSQPNSGFGFGGGGFGF